MARGGMRMRWCWAGLLAIGLLTGAANGVAAEDMPDCIDPQSQMEMTYCAGVDYEKADAELNAIWPDIVAAAKSNDEYVGDMARDRGVPTMVEALRSARLDQVPRRAMRIRGL